jgi:hypothetical protein
MQGWHDFWEMICSKGCPLQTTPDGCKRYGRLYNDRQN